MTLGRIGILGGSLSSAAARIFEEDYKDIIAATPHIKYRTSIIVWIVVGVLLLAMFGIMLAVTLGR